MKFRPCIDLHNGQVKQIVGSTLTDNEEPATNFVAAHPPAWFAKRYREDRLPGGHIIKLGPGNDQAAKEALAAWPGGLQIGGGITADNAAEWIAAGASHVIVTSYVFKEGRIDWDRLRRLQDSVGKEKLVLDLSCRLRNNRYYIVTDRWQTFTDEEVHGDCCEKLSAYCDEFLVHAVDVEGKQQGIDKRLIEELSVNSPISVVYAGGVRSLEDLKTIEQAGKGKLDATVGSALDIFGGSLPYKDVVEFCR